MSPDSEWLTDEQINRLSEYRQGDVVSLQRQVWLAHGDLPTTGHSRDHAVRGALSSVHEAAPNGQVILTQTCDLVPRAGRDRPFVALAPLVRLEEANATLARRGRMPRYAHVPAFEDGSCFADLDRITTVETGLLLLQNRKPGLSNDAERMSFARALARKFDRYAFPDDLHRSLSKWRTHVVSRHDRESSSEGSLYRSAVGVRVSADPVWDADRITVLVTVLFPPGFLPPTDPETMPDVGDVERLHGSSSAELAEQICNGGADANVGGLMCERLGLLWSERCECVGRIATVEFALAGTDDMTVDEYLRSVSFDLEFLTAA
ncbi:MAG: hypothetical protein OXC00_00605 [Acidimicrobiaceae bacterium]|nr:hypothetical protein [Acidimicrobiaceae bacterium]